MCGLEDAIRVLYADSALAVCVKPAGCLSEPGSGRSLPVLLAAQLSEDGRPVYTVHRLDREVGGLTVLARSHEAASKLIAQFTSRSVTKEYFAVLRGVPEEAQAVLEDLLFRDAARNKTYVVSRPRKGVRDARLEYALLADANDGAQPLSLVRVRLFTGRTHQIRVQFASRQHPLVGDGRYGGRDDRCRIALFACQLAFTHPVTQRQMRFFQTPDLSAFPWRLFPETKFDDSSDIWTR